MGCCKKILDLGTFSTCFGSLLDMGIVAQMQGDYTLKLFFLTDEFIIKTSWGVGDRILFPANKLNESFTYVGELYDPQNQRVIITRDGEEYDCVQFRTVLSNDISA